MEFIDLDKVYDKVPREVFNWALMRIGVSKTYINIIEDIKVHAPVSKIYI